MRGLLHSAVLACVVAVSAGAAHAQATRTWVSGVGDDVNPCSRTAPCKTFAGAISKTAAGGEISVLDPGGFGAITITKSISLVAEGAEGGVLASLVNGITVNGANVVVNVRGLIIEGAGNGVNGIRFLNGAALHVQNCIIRGFNAAGPNGNGILFAPGVFAELDVSDTVIANNGTGSTGAGVMIRPTAGGSAKVSLTRVSMLNNVVGLQVDGFASTAGINVAVHDSTISNNASFGVAAVTGATPSFILLHDSAIVMNAAAGLRADGAGAVVRVGRSVITGNIPAATTANGGTVASYGTNQINGNPTGDGTFSSVPQS